MQPARAAVTVATHSGFPHPPSSFTSLRSSSWRYPVQARLLVYLGLVKFALLSSWSSERPPVSVKLEYFCVCLSKLLKWALCLLWKVSRSVANMHLWRFESDCETNSQYFEQNTQRTTMRSFMNASTCLTSLFYTISYADDELNIRFISFHLQYIFDHFVKSIQCSGSITQHW